MTRFPPGFYRVAGIASILSAVTGLVLLRVARQGEPRLEGAA